MTPCEKKPPFRRRGVGSEGCVCEGCICEGCICEGSVCEGCVCEGCISEGCISEGCISEECICEGCVCEGCICEGCSLSVVPENFFFVLFYPLQHDLKEAGALCVQRLLSKLHNKNSPEDKHNEQTPNNT